MMLKKSFFILFVFLSLFVVFSSSFSLAEECIQGKDGYCDTNCILEDFDCADNPYQEGNLLDDEDKDLYDPFDHIKTIEEENIILEGNSEMKGDYVELIKNEERIIPRYYYFIAGLIIIFLSLFIYLIHHRVSKSEIEYHKQMALLSNYVSNLRENNYSDEQIRKSFQDRYYDEQTINKLLSNKK